MARGGNPHHIKWVAMDMLHCYAKGVREQFPQAQIVYDRYHLMVMAGEAVDEVRRSLQRQGAQLKGALWSLRGNPWNLDAEQQQTRNRLAQQYKPIGRALALREPCKIFTKLPALKVQSFSNAGVNGPLAVDWPLSANLLRPSASTGKASLVTSNATSPRERSKQSMASSNWLNDVPAVFVTSPIYAPSLTGSRLNSKSAFLRYYPLETARRHICVRLNYSRYSTYSIGSMQS